MNNLAFWSLNGISFITFYNFVARSGKSGQSYWIKKSICYYFALNQNAQETVWK